VSAASWPGSAWSTWAEARGIPAPIAADILAEALEADRWLAGNWGRSLREATAEELAAYVGIAGLVEGYSLAALEAFRSFLADEGVLVPDTLRPPRAHRRAPIPASGCAAAGRR